MSLFSNLKDKLTDDGPVGMTVSAPDSVSMREPSFDVRIDFQSNSPETLSVTKVTVVLIKRSAEPDGSNDQELSHVSSSQPLQLMPKAAQNITLTLQLTAGDFIEELGSGGSSSVLAATAKAADFFDKLSQENSALRKYVIDVNAWLNNGQSLNERVSVSINS